MAAAAVEKVRDSTESRYRLAAAFYHGPNSANACGRYSHAELSFLHWAIERGVLNDPSGKPPGSPWWRALNDKLLLDKVEADHLAGGAPGAASSRNVELWLEFMRSASAASWYRAHNGSIVAGYLEHQSLAETELSAERFMINVALLRVLYAHALAAAPRLALGPFAPLGRLLGDPRRRSVARYLDLRDTFPESYPLDGWRLEYELHQRGGLIARAIDYGVIASRLTELYEFAAACLDEPRVAALVKNGTPCYAWPAEERVPWLVGTTGPLPRAIALATGGRHPRVGRS
jgi:hypothetical protein